MYMSITAQQNCSNTFNLLKKKKLKKNHSISHINSKMEYKNKKKDKLK